MDEQGNVAWSGESFATGRNMHAFVDSFDLGDSVYGSTPYSFAYVDGIGTRGDVLWHVMETDETMSFYMSHPVPEPSVLLLALPVLALIIRRRR